MRNLLLAVVAAGGLFGAGAAARIGVAHATPSIPIDQTIPDVAERAVESVVNISTTHAVQGGPADFDPFFSDPDSPGFRQQSERQQMALGSGVIVTAGGRILTNSHVVANATTIMVTLPDGTEQSAKLVGNDVSADVAVIQLEGKVSGLKALPIGDSSALRLGEVVLAVGNPLGIGKSVTMGIVSAKGRAGLGIEDYEDFIQTDAAINHGNSGGALVNMKGELVGINTAIAPDQRGGYSGIGFAIPTNMARPIMDMLVKTGKVTRGYLGAQIGTATPELAAKYKLGANRGAVIAHVEADSPGAKGGLQEGDVVTSLDRKEVRSGDVLRNTIAMSPPGSLVELEVVHMNAGREILKVKLGERPEMQPKASIQRRRR